MLFVTFFQQSVQPCSHQLHRRVLVLSTFLRRSDPLVTKRPICNTACPFLVRHRIPAFYGRLRFVFQQPSHRFPPPPVLLQRYVCCGLASVMSLLAPFQSRIQPFGHSLLCVVVCESFGRSGAVVVIAPLRDVSGLLFF